MTTNELYSVRMRASKGEGKKGRHICGAERIVKPECIPEIASILARRALDHSRGRPDTINIKIEVINERCLNLTALPARAIACQNSASGREIAAKLLASVKIDRAAELIEMLANSDQMRGAMLVDADSLERLEPDKKRGIRATCMSDTMMTSVTDCKNHYYEAIVLATKVAAAPGIIAEICISDDPEYVTGYVASSRLGYVRIQVLKDLGIASGGRIFVWRGNHNDLEKTIRFLEQTPVLVSDILPPPEFE